MHKPYIIGIAGGSGSGKTTIARKIAKHFADKIQHIPHDRYYRDQAQLSMTDREKTNYDHPASLETERFITDLQNILKGETVDVPEYDFVNHTRAAEVTAVSPTPLILLEGILLFENQELRDLMDLKIFVDVPSDIRFIRRLKRDMEERGRTFDFATSQYLQFTRPMHEAFIEPSKYHSDIIIPHGGYNEKAINTLIDTIEKQLK
ncbi:MAG: uridine kinase [Weeksellaceae bacterium]